MNKFKNLAYGIGIVAVASLSATGNTYGANLNINTGISNISLASSSKPEGLKYAKEKSSVYKSNAPQKYKDKIRNISISDFDSAIMQDYYKEYRNIYKSASFTNAKYEAICNGTTRGFGLNGKFYIFTEGFTVINNTNNGRQVIYVLKATSNEHSYYIAEKKKYYTYLGQRHKGSVYTYNFKDGNRYVTIQYNRDKSVLIESSTY